MIKILNYGGIYIQKYGGIYIQKYGVIMFEKLSKWGNCVLITKIWIKMVKYP